MKNKFWAGKKVLITGNTGFKGSWLSIWLQMYGADVYGISLKPLGNSLFLLTGLDKENNNNYLNIKDYLNLNELIFNLKPDIIFHLAAQPLVRYSYENPRETYETNVIGTLNLFEAIRIVKSVKVFLNITTDKCYENKEWNWSYREIDRLGGHDPYSSSKACSEILTESYKKSFFPNSEVCIATARAGNVIGGGDFSKDRLVPDLLEGFNKNQFVKIRNPKSIRPWQHVLDCLSGYINLAEKMFSYPSEYSQNYNFGPEENDIKNVEFIANYIKDKWGSKVDWGYDLSLQTHEAKLLKLDISKAKNELEWTPTWNLEIALMKTLNWHFFFNKNKSKEALKEYCQKQINEFLRDLEQKYI
jgi:CDP-glucose 4,6-dehydratase